MAADADPAGGQVSADVGNAARQKISRLRMPIAAGLVFAVTLGGLLGWLGYRAYEIQRAEHQRDLFLQVASQAAVNLTTISDTETDADVQRILDSAIGRFHDEFQQRVPAFVDAIKKAHSTTQGSVTAVALESEDADHAEVLVAVAVKTMNAAAPQQEPRGWRMRIGVQKAGNVAKVAEVAFVP